MIYNVEWLDRFTWHGTTSHRENDALVDLSVEWLDRFAWHGATSHRENDALVVTLHAKVHDTRSGGVQERKNDEQRANCCHFSPESLGKVNVSGYDAPSDKEI